MLSKESPLDKFLSCARSLPYITAWAVLMIVALVLVFVASPAEGIEVAGLFVAELAAVSYGATILAIATSSRSTSRRRKSD